MPRYTWTMPTTSDTLRADLCPTGPLRAVINLGNPVLVQGTPQEPTGVTVDITREIAGRLGVDVELLPVTAARDAYAALVDGRADLGFLAIEPAREEGVRFTTPYVQIEGVFATRDASLTVADVDRPGTTTPPAAGPPTTSTSPAPSSTRRSSGGTRRRRSSRPGLTFSPACDSRSPPMRRSTG